MSRTDLTLEATLCKKCKLFHDTSAETFAYNTECAMMEGSSELLVQEGYGSESL